MLIDISLEEGRVIHLHSLRYTYCIELLGNGVPIYTVQMWMRHSLVQTTQNYADLLTQMLEKRLGRQSIINCFFQYLRLLSSKVNN
ncbi:MAG: hypothetical protein CNE38_04410 [Rhodothermaeota bacterium MED-G12]|nr:MAG: hypothetical protein CNE38_04410 [Rhodothermaeota bacterium MED-G12]